MTLPLGHSAGVGLGVHPCAAGLAISQDGQTLVAANYYNDSITVFRGGLGNWWMTREIDLRPGKNDPSQSGVPRGRVSVLGGDQGKWSGGDSLCIEHPRQGNRRCEAWRPAMDRGAARSARDRRAHPGEGPAEQDDPECLPVAALCGRGPVGHGRRDRHRDEYVVRASYVSQSLDQLRNRTALTLGAPPSIAPIFIPECSAADGKFDCPLNGFVRMADSVIDRKSADLLR